MTTECPIHFITECPVQLALGYPILITLGYPVLITLGYPVIITLEQALLCHSYTKCFVFFTATTATFGDITLIIRKLNGGRRGGRRVI